jgi:hypothetical protein
VLLKLRAAAPIVDPLKKLNELVTKTQISGVGKVVQKFPIRFVAISEPHFFYK